MKILHTTRGLLKRGGGPAYTVPSLAIAQHNHGVDVDLLLDEDENDFDPPQGINIFHRSQLKVPLHQLIAGYAIVHDNGVWLPCNHHVAVAATKAGVPRVITPHGALQSWIWNQRRWKKELGWFFYQKRDLYTASAIFATADIEVSRISELGYKGRILNIPNGVDAPGIYVPKDDKITKSMQILFLSRIHEKKGVPELIEAWVKIRPEGWHLTVAGPDESHLVPGLKAKLDRAGLLNSVSFPGPLLGDARVEAFRDASFFVLPTHSENFGLVVLEAMLMGTPVMTTTGTPWGEFESLGIGWICEPTAAPIEKKLRSVLALEGNVFLETGRKAYAWANDRFTWKTVAEQTLTCYRSILGDWNRDPH